MFTFFTQPLFRQLIGRRLVSNPQQVALELSRENGSYPKIMSNPGDNNTSSIGNIEEIFRQYQAARNTADKAALETFQLALSRRDEGKYLQKAGALSILDELIKILGSGNVRDLTSVQRTTLAKAYKEKADVLDKAKGHRALDETLACLRKALEISPGFVEAQELQNAIESENSTNLADNYVKKQP